MFVEAHFGIQSVREMRLWYTEFRNRMISEMADNTPNHCPSNPSVFITDGQCHARKQPPYLRSPALGKSYPPGLLFSDSIRKPLALLLPKWLSLTPAWNIRMQRTLLAPFELHWEVSGDPSILPAGTSSLCRARPSHSSQLHPPQSCQWDSPRT